MQLVRDPDNPTALEFLATELEALHEGRGRLLQAIGVCTVKYVGRARSMLSRGTRLVILKPDGTLLVHTAAGAKPVNWQPPGASMAAAIHDGRVVVTARRAKPEEMVEITFEAIDLLLATPLADPAALALVGTEDDLQALLFARPELVEPGFVPSRRERDSRRGFYDLDGRDVQGRRLIVEVKRVTAGVAEAQQLWRYVQEQRGAAGTADTVRGILIAPKVAAKARTLLAAQALEWKELDWDDMLPKVEAMRQAGQSSLLKY
jgi:RecB family endonuclease NucS